MMAEADILLLLISNTAAWKGNYPGKLFEYLASGKPVLLVGPEGEAADLIRSTGSGLFIPADDVPSLARVLRDLSGGVQAFRQGCFQPRPEMIARYERRALTRRLAAIFDELTRP
jgi:glycosyltransferase involved in cell wall biosynthesis